MRTALSFVALALANSEESVVIDSNGAAVASVMRRETPQLHSFFEVSQQVENATKAKATSTNTTKPSNTTAATDNGKATSNATKPATDGAPTSAKAANLTKAGIDVEDDRSQKAPEDRPDLKYHYVDEKLPGSCDAHYRYEGVLSNDDCARKCYETFGCTRFSAGGCSQGCRISVVGKNAGKTAAPADGQCTTTAAGDAGNCIVYQLSFFHAVNQPGACSGHFVYKKDAKTKAACAHACKNEIGCTKFTAEPNCMGGCRISKCGSNPAGGACPKDKQCPTTMETGCTVYELYR